MSTENTFIDKISNEQTALLPAIEFRGEIRIMNTNATSTTPAGTFRNSRSSGSTPRPARRSARE